MDNPTNILPRYLQQPICDALADTPVVLLAGARQTGKTTLARQIAQADRRDIPDGDDHSRRRSVMVSLDDGPALLAAQNDPDGFLAGLVQQAAQEGGGSATGSGIGSATGNGIGLILLDEVQRAPAIFRALKAQVDKNRAPGRFLLTGSADVRLLPGVESLAGRMEAHTLWPLMAAEIARQPADAPRLVDTVFAPDFPARAARLSYASLARARWAEILVAGGFPEPLRRAAGARRRAWFENYISSLLLRDLPDLARIENGAALPRLLRLLATRSASLLNLSGVAGDSTIPYATLRRYMNLLATLFLTHELPAWASNRGQRLIKSPKLLLCDSGLMAALLGVDADGLSQSPLFGAALETWAILELVKQVGITDAGMELFHFRDAQQRECDAVLERADGRVVGLEIKATSAPTPDDFRGLRALAESAGSDRFVRGVLLYAGGSDAASRGNAVLSFGENLHAVPLSILQATVPPLPSDATAVHSAA